MTKNYNQRKRKFEHVQFEESNSHQMDHKVFHNSNIDPFLTTSMLETKYIGNNFVILVADLAVVNTNPLFFGI